MKKPQIHFYLSYFTFCGLIFFGFAVSTNAQPYRTAFNQGDSLYQLEQYYEAYLRFNAAEVLSRNAGNAQFALRSREWLDKAAYGIQRQQVVTDSLLKATRKLTDAFYFWDGRLALAYNRYRYGFINKKGEAVLDYKYSSATNFDETTGYAKVVRSDQNYWLAPDGKEYPGDQDVNKLPKIEKGSQVGMDENQLQVAKTLDNFTSTGKKDYHRALTEGIKLYHKGQYYAAYLRFNAVGVLAENANDRKTAQLGKQLKDTTIYEIRNLFTRAEAALDIAQNIRKAFYFYDNKFALAFNSGSFYFINNKGEEFTELGRWEKAAQFDDKGLAKVEKNGLQFLIDTTGQSYQVAYALGDLKKGFTALDLRGTLLDSFPSEILDHLQLQVLLLDGNYDQRNSISTLPRGLQKLQQLKVLSLGSCNLIELAAEISQLQNLTTLDLSGNQLSALPAQIGQLQHLSYLDLSGNQFSALPAQIGQLQHLTDLDLSGNQLSALPAQIGQLQNLTTLDLSGNQLSVLPAQIGQLQHLSYLDLSFNKLSALPTEIGQLQNLTDLDLSFNKLSALPTEIGQLQNLTDLDLSFNQLSALPAEIGQLQHLTNLNLMSNQLSALPTEIVQLQNLTNLDLSGNQLSALPAEIVQLQNLTDLSLSDNQLSTLPAQIGQLQNLTNLSLSFNQLSALPTEIVQLQNLTNLSLRSNQLSALPAEIVQLQNLNSLSLGGNQLSELPAEIVQLQHLTDLDLWVNQLSALPAEIVQLQNLTDLNLSYNQLSELPAEIVQLQNLTDLNLSDNQLSELPAEIVQLQNLTDLNLSDNQLSELPAEIVQLQNLTDLDLRGNLLSKNYIEQLQREMPWCNIRPSPPSAADWFAAKKYSEAFTAQQKAIASDSMSYNNWYNLSWYALFVKKPQEAIKAARKTLEFNPEALGVETNLALGYLLNNQWPEAEKIYKKWKGKHFPNDDRLWDDVFLQDIKDLEAAGIEHADFEKVRQLFKK